MFQQIKKDLHVLSNPTKAKILQKFFKTGKGEYGEGDIFLGLTVPQTRSIANQYLTLSLGDTERLLRSKIHEERQIALMILVEQFQKATDEEREEIYDFYLSHTKYINNWDLIDGSAPTIVGEYIWNHPEQREGSKFINKDSSSTTQNDILRKLAISSSLWERRIAILATFAYIKHGDYSTTFAISDLLMKDKEDLMHKAVGWMLREVEKKFGKGVLRQYLKTRYKTMPRTMLRYSIEHFTQGERKAYLLGEV